MRATDRQLGMIGSAERGQLHDMLDASPTRPGHDGQKYILTGPEALSYYDIARILSDVIGRPVEYYDRFDEGRDRNTLAAHQRAGGKTAIVHDTVRRILRRDPRSFAEFARDHADIFRPRHDEPAFEVSS